MKSVALAVVLIGIGCHGVFADGYPFDPSTREVKGDTVRLRLSEPQVESLSATGLVTLSDSQLSLIHRFYPKASRVQDVITATFNDNIEGLSDEDVYVFWVAAEELAITLNSKVIANEFLRESALARLAVRAESDIRIAPNGQICISGKRATMREAFALIAARGNGPERNVTVSVAPPFQASSSDCKDSRRPLQDGSVPAESSSDNFKALVSYGASLNVAVNQSW